MRFDEIEIDARNLPDSGNGRGLYINSSDNVVTYNGIDVPTHSILFPNNLTLDLPFENFDDIEFTGSNYNDYFKDKSKNIKTLSEIKVELEFQFNANNSSGDNSTSFSESNST